MDRINAIVELLGDDNIESIKKRIADIIVRRVEDDLDSYGCYLIYPPDIQETVSDAYESVYKKVKKMYQTAVVDINQDYIDKMKTYMAKQCGGDKRLRAKVFELAKQYSHQGNEYSKERAFSDKLYEILRETETQENSDEI